MELSLLGVSWYPMTGPWEISKDQPLHLDMTQLGKDIPAPEFHGGFAEVSITSFQINFFLCPGVLPSPFYRCCSAILNKSAIHKL